MKTVELKNIGPVEHLAIEVPARSDRDWSIEGLVMTTTAIVPNQSSASFNIGTTVEEPKSYRCHLAIMKDEEGGFSVVVLNLPGAGGCGESEEDAVSSAKESVIGVIESYLEDSMGIPWVATGYDIPEGAKLKWVLVDA